MGDELTAPAKGEGTPTPDASMTAEQMTSVVEKGLNDFSTRLTTELQSFGAQVADAVRTSKQAPVVEPPVEGDLATELLQDPGKVIDERIGPKVEAVMRERLSPHLLTQVEDKFQGLLAGHKADIDQEHGEGTWDKLMHDEIVAIFSKLPPESRGSITHVRTVVEQQLGKRATELRPLANEAERKAKQVLESPVMLHGGLPGQVQPGRLTEDDREFAKAYEKATGDEIDLKRLAEIRDIRSGQDRAWTLDDFREKKKETA